MSGDGTLVCTVLCVALGHTSGCPSCKTRSVHFGTTVAQPVVDECVAKHVWVKA
jgi:hypothetical protein